MAAVYDASSEVQPVFKEYARIQKLRDGDTWFSYEFMAWVARMSAWFELETGWIAAARPNEWICWLQKQEVSNGRD